jgi:hypothetical protein
MGHFGREAKVAYYLDLFSPETHQAYSGSDKTVSGFRARHRQAAERVHQGDKLICYVTRISRWVGVLEVVSAPYEDSTPRFYGKDDPFVIRFKVKPLVWLTTLPHALPIREPSIWNSLSITKDYPPKGKMWTGPFRSSLNKISDSDGQFLEQLLVRQTGSDRIEYPLSDAEQRQLQRQTIKREDQKQVEVIVPEDEEEE